SGLEQWAPLLRAVFPFGPATVRAVFARWAVQPPVTIDNVTDEGFRRLVAEHAPSIVPMRVQMQRSVGDVDGCLVEIADIQVEGWRLRTVAVSGQDVDCVAALARRLKLVH